MKFVNRVNSVINNWFTANEVNAAGRLGLFRIIFSLFYIWDLSSHFAARLSALPANYYRPLLILEYFPKRLPVEINELLESMLVAALALLLIGFRVRLVTWVVLVVGCILEAYYRALWSEHSTAFLVFYIPVFMLPDCLWGDTYSLDSLLKKRAGEAVVNPSDGSCHYSLPARALLVVLSGLYLSAALFKVLGDGTWLKHSDIMAEMVLRRSIQASIYKLPVNALAPLIAQTPALYESLRLFTLLFEGFFFLALFNRKILYLFVPLALLFHSVSALWLIITFTPILIVYLIYVDWQSLRESLFPRRIAIVDAIPSRWFILGSLILALGAGIFWNNGNELRSVINIGGLLDWRTIWYPVLPVSVISLIVSFFNVFRR